MDSGRIRRRTLPHIDVEDKPTFITACLKGSISQIGLKQIRSFRDELDRRQKPVGINESEWQNQKHKVLFAFVDRLLDGNCPVNYLADDQLAKIVCNAFLHFADIRYRLLAFVVMPSHHHWIFMPTQEWVQQSALHQQASQILRTPRESISHSIQSFTANECNRVLGRSGHFWQIETFDHYARSEDELFRIIHYIEQNPVAAGLVSHAEEYRWSSAYVRSKLGLHVGDCIPNGKSIGDIWEA